MSVESFVESIGEFLLRQLSVQIATCSKRTVKAKEAAGGLDGCAWGTCLHLLESGVTVKGGVLAVCGAMIPKAEGDTFHFGE